MFYGEQFQPFDVDQAELAIDLAGRDNVSVRVIYPERCQVGVRTRAIIFAHGKGASHFVYTPLADYLARRGYAVIQPEFRDSTAPDNPDYDPDNSWWRERIQDMLMLAALVHEDNAVWPINLESNFIIAGHSWGAQTALYTSGASYVPAAENMPMSEGHAPPGLVGTFVLSPPGIDETAADAEESWSEMNAPCMFLTGTDDHASERTAFPWTWRVEPFTRYGNMNIPRRGYLSVIKGGDHSFGGITESPDKPINMLHQRITLSQIHAFCDTCFQTQEQNPEPWDALDPLAGSLYKGHEAIAYFGVAR